MSGQKDVMYALMCLAFTNGICFISLHGPDGNMRHGTRSRGPYSSCVCAWAVWVISTFPWECAVPGTADNVRLVLVIHRRASQSGAGLRYVTLLRAVSFSVSPGKTFLFHFLTSQIEMFCWLFTQSVLFPIPAPLPLLPSPTTSSPPPTTAAPVPFHLFTTKRHCNDGPLGLTFQPINSVCQTTSWCQNIKQIATSVK